MSAYFILTQTVTDPQRYGQEYIAKVLPFLAKYKAEVIVAELQAKPLQGDPATGCCRSPLSLRTGDPELRKRSGLSADQENPHEFDEERECSDGSRVQDAGVETRDGFSGPSRSRESAGSLKAADAFGAVDRLRRGDGRRVVDGTVDNDARAKAFRAMDWPTPREPPTEISRPLPGIGVPRARAQNRAHDDARIALEKPLAGFLARDRVPLDRRQSRSSSE
jgi:hypothetical protein